MDLNINYEDVSFKSSPNDYDYTSFVHERMGRNHGNFNKLSFEGHFDNKNYDSSELKHDSNIRDGRRGEPFTKTVKVDGVDVTKTYYRYQLILPIQHGLCHGQILPANLHFLITFYRSNAKKGE